MVRRSSRSACYILDVDGSNRVITDERFDRYTLSMATAIMFWMVVKKPPTDVARRVRQNKE